MQRHSRPKSVVFQGFSALGFAIPYLHAGGDHEYFPDFLVWLANGLMVILETKGHDEREGVKVQAAERWVRAVNTGGSHGEWRYALTHNPNKVPQIIDLLAQSQEKVLAAAAEGGQR